MQSRSRRRRPDGARRATRRSIAATRHALVGPGPYLRRSSGTAAADRACRRTASASVLTARRIRCRSPAGGRPRRTRPPPAPAHLLRRHRHGRLLILLGLRRDSLLSACVYRETDGTLEASALACGASRADRPLGVAQYDGVVRAVPRDVLVINGASTSGAIESLNYAPRRRATFAPPDAGRLGGEVGAAAVDLDREPLPRDSLKPPALRAMSNPEEIRRTSPAAF
jgi:hypothetical protein